MDLGKHTFISVLFLKFILMNIMNINSCLGFILFQHIEATLSLVFITSFEKSTVIKVLLLPKVIVFFINY